MSERQKTQVETKGDEILAGHPARGSRSDGGRAGLSDRSQGREEEREDVREEEEEDVWRGGGGLNRPAKAPRPPISVQCLPGYPLLNQCY